MKKIITLLLFITLYHVGRAQVWTNVTNTYPGVSSGGRGCGAFSIGGTCYFVGGGPYYYDTWAFDTLGDTWTQEQSYPNTVDGTYVGISLNGLGYIATGVGYGYGWDSTLWQFNPTATNQWTKLAHFPGQPRGYDVGFTIDGLIFVGSGIGNSKGGVGVPLNDFYEYNPTTNTWKQIANYPGNGTQYNVSFTIGDKAYVGCGATVSSNGYTTLNTDSDFWEYDTISKVWTRIAGFGGGVRAAATGLSTCDKGYVGLGYSDVNQQDVYNDFWTYDPNSNTWTQVGNYGGVARFVANGFIIGKSFFVGLGVNGSNGTQADIWEFIRSFTPAFSADTSVCQGGSITFTDTSNYSPTNWYWQFLGGTPDTSTSQNPTIAYDAPGLHNVILTAWNDCGDTGTKTFTNYVTVGSGGILTILPASPLVCSGQNVKLIVQDTGSFTWSPSVGLSATTGDSVVVSDTATTVYIARGASSGGCALAGTDTVKIVVAPPLIVLPLSPSTCVGQPVTLSVDTSGSNYVWIPALTLSSSTGDSVSATPVQQTTYMVTGIDSSGCPVTGYDTVSVRVGFNKPKLTDTDNVLTTTATEGNQWYRNGSEINGATGEKYTATDTGCYWDIATNIANGCSSISDTLCITPSGIKQVSPNSNQLSIYPNPTNGEITLNISSSVGEIKDWYLQITDVLGRTVYTKPSLNYSNDIDLSNLPGGVYFISVLNTTGRVVAPVVKQ